MSERTTLVGLLITSSFLVILLYVAFGQITVRRLRKNPNTRAALGFELVSGWDIINTAQALALPRSWSRKLEGTPLATIHAKSDVLLAHTSRFDHILAAIFYWLLMLSGLGGAVLVLLNSLGLFR